MNLGNTRCHTSWPCKIMNSAGEVVEIPKDQVYIEASSTTKEVEMQMPFGDDGSTFTVWTHAPLTVLDQFPYSKDEDTSGCNIIVGGVVAPLIPKWFAGGVYTVPAPSRVKYNAKRQVEYVKGLTLFRQGPVADE